jgi:hypothetical protein
VPASPATPLLVAPWPPSGAGTPPLDVLAPAPPLELLAPDPLALELEEPESSPLPGPAGWLDVPQLAKKDRQAQPAHRLHHPLRWTDRGEISEFIPRRPSVASEVDTARPS